MSMQRFGIKSLKQIFTVFLWATLTVVILFTVFIFAYLYNNINDVKNSTLESVCYNSQRMIKEQIETIYDAEEVILSNRDIQEFLNASDEEEKASLKIIASDFLLKSLSTKGNRPGVLIFSNDEADAVLGCKADENDKKRVEELCKKYREHPENKLHIYKTDSLFPEIYVCDFSPVRYHSLKEVAAYDVGTLAVFSKINTYEFKRIVGKNPVILLKVTNDVLGEDCVLVDTTNGKVTGTGTVMRSDLGYRGWYIRAELYKITGINYLTPFFIVSVILVLILLAFLFLFKASIKNMVDIPIKKISSYLEDFVLSNSKTTKEMKTVKVNEFDEILRHINKLFARIGAQARYIVKTQQKMYEQELLANEQTIYMNQLQINPHFLFNTLNTIAQMCREEGLEDVTEITGNISDIFRYSIEGDYKATLDEEIYIVLKYLKILNSRYKREFNCTLDIEDELYEYPVIKMIIQPLIENSFRHGGIANKEEPVLKISAERKEDCILISVYDNGCGIEKDKLETINEDLRSAKTKHTKSIGLFNINKRLKACYGDESGLEVRSEYGKYTEVLLKIK